MTENIPDSDCVGIRAENAENRLPLQVEHAKQSNPISHHCEPSETTPRASANAGIRSAQ
ncbi:MAG: hypothetical protein LBO79_00670 [Zoogloeaceae bacterium]|nr:hypothetical protein [Zoogloeaceae bacterium]